MERGPAASLACCLEAPPPPRSEFVHSQPAQELCKKQFILRCAQAPVEGRHFAPLRLRPAYVRACIVTRRRVASQRERNEKVDGAARRARASLRSVAYNNVPRMYSVQQRQTHTYRD